MHQCAPLGSGCAGTLRRDPSSGRWAIALCHSYAKVTGLEVEVGLTTIVFRNSFLSAPHPSLALMFGAGGWG
jgi:hypothetical protein